MATIFVADDNPHVHSMVEEALSAEGHEVTCTVDGAGALESIAEMKPDVVLLDSALNEMDPLQTCRDVLALPGMEQSRMILLAGPLESIDTAEALEAGFATVLQKPLDAQALVDLVGNGQTPRADSDWAGASAQPPAVDDLVHRALGHLTPDQLRDMIREQVEDIVTMAVPSLIEHITDRLAEKLKPR